MAHRIVLFEYILVLLSEASPQCRQFLLHDASDLHPCLTLELTVGWRWQEIKQFDVREDRGSSRRGQSSTHLLVWLQYAQNALSACCDVDVRIWHDEQM